MAVIKDYGMYAQVAKNAQPIAQLAMSLVHIIIGFLSKLFKLRSVHMHLNGGLQYPSEIILLECIIIKISAM